MISTAPGMPALHADEHMKGTAASVPGTGWLWLAHQDFAMVSAWIQQASPLSSARGRLGTESRDSSWLGNTRFYSAEGGADIFSS